MNWLDVHFIYTKEQMEQLQQHSKNEQAAVKVGC